jgi:hypothetical protein
VCVCVCGWISFLSDSGQKRVMMSSIQANGPWSCIKYWDLLDSEELLAFQGRFCYVELVNLLVTPPNIVFVI